MTDNDERRIQEELKTIVGRIDRILKEVRTSEDEEPSETKTPDSLPAPGPPEPAS